MYIREMIQFFKQQNGNIYAVQAQENLSAQDCEKLQWLFQGAVKATENTIAGKFVGPRREMITPWSTNAVEICQNMGIKNLQRIEQFLAESNIEEFDPMLQRRYKEISQDIFKIEKQAEPIIYIDDILAYSKQEGLALSEQEVNYLEDIAKKLDRKLSDSEVFGFSQVNSEHCRHKIFNGKYIIDGEEKELSLFKLIRKTSDINPNDLVSAYKDNVAFNEGPEIEQFAPTCGEKPAFFKTKQIKSVISIKAETHNFPTTVEPFNGAATGTGGEIRDRLGGGKASLPIAGTAVYMTAYPRTQAGKNWEENIKTRNWLYQTPEQILIKASNGASDFGNKFGQPLICGSVLTFEHEENNKQYGFDKVIMLAGGVGFGTMRDALKGHPAAGEKVVVMGGDNYRIGMGGGAVSSVDTGEFNNAIELNAVQRANPEMQKRAANVIRTLAESDSNPIISMHDHGAGGHLNCLSELVEETGGKININALPIGDPTLSAKEIVGNESQERMGMIMKEENVALVEKIAQRERTPMYVVGETTGDMNFVFEQEDGKKPIDLRLDYMIGNPPRTIITDKTIKASYATPSVNSDKIQDQIEAVLSMESVACKDWLTNKVDRSVTGKVALQQCAGELQLPLNNTGVVALDFQGKSGIATSIGHAPLAALADPEAGSVLAIAESLTNIVWVPLQKGLNSVSLSANWMWPCKNEGEDARLYKAVEACSDFACSLGINIPTGKDSLSMTQKYKNKKVISPGTVIISAGAEVADVRKTVTPVLENDENTSLYYIDLSFDKMKLGGSVFYQTLNAIGNDVPSIQNPEYFVDGFTCIQELINNDLVLAGHDISEGGLVTALLEMCFANTKGGLNIDFSDLAENNLQNLLFAENPGVFIQVADTKSTEELLAKHSIAFAKIGQPTAERVMSITNNKEKISLDIDAMRDVWYKTSYLLDCKQSGEACAKERYANYKNQALDLQISESFSGQLAQFDLNTANRKSKANAAIIREKGTNGEREMAYALYLAGFNVKDVHMTDLASGREDLCDIQMIVFCGGFSNSDVLGSAKGWAGGFKYNETAKKALAAFYQREDTLSLGICNGCQLMIELDLINPEHEQKAKMLHNDSHKFESNFVGVNIPANNSVMLGTLETSQLGIWVAHGEGKFSLPYDEGKYNIVAKYQHDAYPANPNGSDYSVAGICSADGRHLAMMPHLERAVFPWQWAHYPAERKATDEITPWVEAFVNARQWIENV